MTNTFTFKGTKECRNNSYQAREVTIAIDIIFAIIPWDSLVAQVVKRLPRMGETQVQSLCWEDPLEKEMATHSSILA